MRREPVDEALLGTWRADERTDAATSYSTSLAGRVTTDATPWDFDELCRAELGRLPASSLVVDVGSGDRSGLLDLDPMPDLLVATVPWPDDVDATRHVLRPLGARVAVYDAASARGLPVAEGTVDLVIDRHEDYDPRHVARALRPGGLFVTEQVGAWDGEERYAWFGTEPTFPDPTLAQAKEEMRAAGLEVTGSGDCVGRHRFQDVPALVAYWHRKPWEVPEDFCVDAYADMLMRLHRENRTLELTMHRFWIAARARH